MAFASIGALGTAQNKTSSTTHALTTTATAEVGNVIIVAAAWNNAGTSDGDTTQLTCADSAGNTYTRIREYTNSAGAADDGVCLTAFHCVVTTELASGGTITVTSASARTAKAMTAHEFSKGSGTTLAVENTALDEGVNNDPASFSLGSLTSREYLFLYYYGRESTGTLTLDTDLTSAGAVGTSGGGSDTNMQVAAAYNISTGTASPTIDCSSSSDTNEYAQIIAAIYEVPSDISPPGLNVPITFGGASLVSTLTATGLNVPITFGSPSVDSVLTATGLNVPITFGDAALVADLLPSGLNVPIAFGAASLSTGDISPPGLNVPISFGEAVLQSVLSPSGLNVPISFGAASLDAILSATGLNVPITFGSPQVLPVFSPAGLVVPITFGAASFLATLTATALVVPISFGSASLQEPPLITPITLVDVYMESVDLPIAMELADLAVELEIVDLLIGMEIVDLTATLESVDLPTEML